MNIATRAKEVECVMKSTCILAACAFLGCRETPLSNSDSSECRLNSDCLIEQICQESRCVADPEVCLGEMYPCASDTDCDSVEICDGLESEEDNRKNCPNIPNPDQTYHDEVMDEIDNCPRESNPTQEELDLNIGGDVCEGDHDFNGVRDDRDNCLVNSNPDQSDHDADGQGEARVIVVSNMSDVGDGAWTLVAEGFE